MATSPKKLTASVVGSHPAISLLPGSAQGAVNSALSPLFAQTSCAYAAIPCPRDLKLWPPPFKEVVADSETSKAEKISRMIR